MYYLCSVKQKQTHQPFRNTDNRSIMFTAKINYKNGMVKEVKLTSTTSLLRENWANWASRIDRIYFIESDRLRYYEDGHISAIWK